ncbi:MAG TPA: SDR family NAD(P)-dependent oxidoreductase [Casimicrobiaceae bacterium]|nr:SDR family NAD(P)-dependent oxidoreductase [Casimicrobiaceae bacterium]
MSDAASRSIARARVLRNGGPALSMDLGLAGKVALVTGAGGGIGATIATTLAAQGCVVQLGDMNLAAADRSAALCSGRGYAVALDVGDARAVADTVSRIVREHGRIDILVNNAGILKTGPVSESSIADWDDVCRVNLSGVYYCCKAVIAPMMAQRHGKIVNIASVSAVKGGGSFGNVLYGTTKAGVVALTKGLARELAPHGINVNAIAPGVIETGMTEQLMTPERRKMVLAAIPAGRFASTQDIASMVALLCSDVLAYVNGATVPVDGAYLTR